MRLNHKDIYNAKIRTINHPNEQYNYVTRVYIDKYKKSIDLKFSGEKMRFKRITNCIISNYYFKYYKKYITASLTYKTLIFSKDVNLIFNMYNSLDFNAHFMSSSLARTNIPHSQMTKEQLEILTKAQIKAVKSFPREIDFIEPTEEFIAIRKLDSL